MSLKLFVVEMFMNMYVKFYENLTIGYRDISDLASPIYMVHPVEVNNA